MTVLTRRDAGQDEQPSLQRFTPPPLVEHGVSFDECHYDVLGCSSGTQERSKTVAAAQANQAPEAGDEPAGGEVRRKPREGSNLRGGSEDEVSRAARLEKEEVAAMAEDENRSVGLDS